MMAVGPATGQEPDTLAGVMDDLERRGFTEHFTVVDGQLRGVDHGRGFPAADVAISELHRFEGISDPDDLAILYALETRNGLRGTLTDAFGVYADPLVGAFMSHVPLRPGAPIRRPVG
jgi:hypothetical protein